MKKRKFRVRGIAVLTAIVSLVTTLQTDLMTVRAAESGQTNPVQTLMREYCPTINEVIDDESGFTHPGVGLTKELLENVRQQVRIGNEPWTTYFKDMIQSSAAALDVTSSNAQSDGVTASSVAFNSQGFNSRFRADGLKAYTQAVLYYITGNVAYRANAMKIIRVWEQMDPDQYAYFTDACIHTGIPLHRMCMAAEILRYTSFEVTDGYTTQQLEWTAQDTEYFINNLVDPTVRTFNSSTDRFMNQQTYTTIGAMSGYLFMDDVTGYEKTVEWFTVNKDARDPGFTGSIKWLFREITTEDSIGDVIGTGTPLEAPVYQHVEMGRDQAHGSGDLTNSAILGRMMAAQNTLVDPVNGTASDNANAVNVYEFLDNRILKAANFFWQYMLGYDTDWVKVPYSIDKATGVVRDTYNYLASGYRGRFNTANFWDIYAYFRYEKGMDIATVAPYFEEAFQKKLPSNFYYGGSLNINWDNYDGGGDFWLFLPADAATDADMWLAEAQRDYLVEIEDRATVLTKDEHVVVEDEYVRVTASDEEKRFAITNGSHGGTVIAVKVRTDGEAKLKLDYGVHATIFLPDTGNEWKYVTFIRDDSEYFEDLMYLSVGELEGTYVDIDHIDIKPETANSDRTIQIVEMDGADVEEQVTYAGGSLSTSFRASARSGQTVVYSGSQLPDGAVLNPSSGNLVWTPNTAGTYSFYVTAIAGDTAAVKKVVIIVVADRHANINDLISSYDENEIYTRRSKQNFLEVLNRTNEIVDTATDAEFTEQIALLRAAVQGLEKVSPRLQNGSLDYSKIVV
nr:Ig domain-containing protein [Acetatifactor sp.]